MVDPVTAILEELWSENWERKHRREPWTFCSSGWTIHDVRQEFVYKVEESLISNGDY